MPRLSGQHGTVPKKAKELRDKTGEVLKVKTRSVTSRIMSIDKYDAPDTFYSLIFNRLSTPSLAMDAAADKFGRKQDDGKIANAIVRHVPGQWQLVLMRSQLAIQTRKLIPNSLELKIIIVDDGIDVSFRERKTIV